MFFTRFGFALRPPAPTFFELEFSEWFLLPFPNCAFLLGGLAAMTSGDCAYRRGRFRCLSGLLGSLAAPGNLLFFPTEGGRGHRAGTCRSHYAVRDVSKLRCSPLAHHPLCVCVCVWMCMCLCVCLCVHVCVRVPWAKAKVRFIYLLFNVRTFR